jgi:DNA-binding transcriptional LysR family regulator
VGTFRDIGQKITLKGKVPIGEKIKEKKGLKNIPFVMGLKNSEYAGMVNEMLRAIGLRSYFTAFRINSFEAMNEFVRSGIGMTIVPEFAVKHEIEANILAEIKIKNAEPTFKIMMLENPRLQSSPSVKLAKGLIKKRILGGL